MKTQFFIPAIACLCALASNSFGEPRNPAPADAASLVAALNVDADTADTIDAANDDDQSRNHESVTTLKRS
jgi:hypothetical protein